MLTINNLSKSYGSNLALNQFTYSFDHGIYALLGPNGSGKSTLMNIVTQNLKSDNGDILLDDTPIGKLGASYREKLGFMPQYPGMYPSFSALDFLRYMAVLKGLNKKKADEQIDELLHAVELHDVRTHRIGSFSGGMKQRLALAQSLLGDPEIVILDEPTAGLDPKQRIAIRNYIASVALNKTVIIATHVVSDVEFIAREAIMLKKGVISDSGSPYELTQKIEGQVWQTVVAAEEVQAMQEKFRVVNIQNGEQGVILRILSDVKPTEDSVKVVPSLEDYYLYVFGDIL
ncbi:MAG: ATP-binding cassette domain-containing protein [Clostridia bacterium]|nr:ATP-binding cassette domain-containing protein [Clostridia bacterium]